MLKCLDLCSGFGGFSEAFVLSENWEVLRIDNNPLLSEVPEIWIIDIFVFRDSLADMIERGYKPDHVDVILASPPCREFSMGYSSPRSQASRAGTLQDYEPNMNILEAIMDIIKMLKPTYYIIENVKGAVKYFTPILGNHKTSIKRTWFLWGKFPGLNINEKLIPLKKTLDVHSKNPLRANHRAVIPIEISKAILHAIECQTTLDFWL